MLCFVPQCSTAEFSLETDLKIYVLHEHFEENMGSDIKQDIVIEVLVKVEQLTEGTSYKCC